VGIDRIIMHQSPNCGVASREMARDWQLFQAVESGERRFGWRTWEITRPAVIVGRSSAVAQLVDEAACRADGVPIVRRCSGGGAVVLGPGCVNYTVALMFVSCPQLYDVAASFSIILSRVITALGIAGLTIEGGTDLVMNDRKISGNAQRRGRQVLLHHGTLLYDFDAALATRYLYEPVRRPAYRGIRSHAAFLANVPLTGADARARLGDALQGLRAIGTSRRRDELADMFQTQTGAG
jgi:lipoate-protein ligase A